MRVLLGSALLATLALAQAEEAPAAAAAAAQAAQGYHVLQVTKSAEASADKLKGQLSSVLVEKLGAKDEQVKTSMKL